MKNIGIRDARALENYDVEKNAQNRTNRAIDDTYGPKIATKKRRKLPGKRKWKNKTQQYQILRGQMTVRLFNLKQKRDKSLKNIFKKQPKLHEQ